MARFKTKGMKVLAALASREARGAEIALARLILGALGVKLGINFAEWVK